MAVLGNKLARIPLADFEHTVFTLVGDFAGNSHHPQLHPAEQVGVHQRKHLAVSAFRSAKPLSSKRQPGNQPSSCPAGQGGRRTVGLDVHLDRGGSSVPLRLHRHGVPSEHVPVVELDANVSPVGNVHRSRSQLGVDVLHPKFRGGCRPPFRLGHIVVPPVRGRKGVVAKLGQ